MSELDEQIAHRKAKLAALRTFQRDYVIHALGDAKGNISQAARACGMTRAALQRILRVLDIDRGAFA